MRLSAIVYSDTEKYFFRFGEDGYIGSGLDNELVHQVVRTHAKANNQRLLRLSLCFVWATEQD
jgi:hypothetical protein